MTKPSKDDQETELEVENDDEVLAEKIVATGRPGPIRPGPMSEGEVFRLLEALLFAATEPLDEKSIEGYLPLGSDVPLLLKNLQATYEARGVNLVCVAQKWQFRTAPDLAPQLQTYVREERRLSRAAIETLAIIAYHQPVTRAEIEEIRGVSVNKGTLDVLIETGWVKPGPRRKDAPGKPSTFLTNENFLSYFGLAELADLPGVDELKAAGLLQSGPLMGNFAQSTGPAADGVLSDPESGELKDAWQERLALEAP